MKRSWLARHPVGFMALYTIFYLSVFHYLESNVPLRSILVHCRLDDLIPFCKYAVIPYFAWFVWIPFTLFYLLWKAPREDFWRLCLPFDRRSGGGGTRFSMYEDQPAFWQGKGILPCNGKRIVRRIR